MPAGTNTSHRRESRCNARTPSHATTTPAPSASTPATHALTASSNGPATKAATVAAQVSSTGPSSNVPGTRNDIRRSGPYDEPSTNASAIAGTNNTIAATAAVHAMATIAATSMPLRALTHNAT